MAHELSFREIQVSVNDIAVRKIELKDLWQALKEGYEDFIVKPSHFVFLAIVYPLFALLLTLFLLGDNLLYLVFPVVVGSTFLGPLVSVLLFEVSRCRESGQTVTWNSAFDFVHTSAFAPILALSAVMVLLYVGWLFMAQLIW